MAGLFFLNIFFSFCLAKTSPPIGKILFFDKNFDLPKSTHLKNIEIEQPESSGAFLPTTDQRDQLFDGHPLPKDWDDLDKDIFYMDLKTKPIYVITRKYPKFEKESLILLQKKIKTK